MYKIEEIKNGFDKFYLENGHYPSAVELDNCSYLPSARQIQRRFNGLPNLKLKLGINKEDIHYGRGKFRSKIAKRSNSIGFAAEKELGDILIKYFGEPFVHLEKPISNSKRTRFDFFIYSKSINFGADVFCSETKRNIQVNINSKINNYKDVNTLIYFVVANRDIDQKLLDQISLSKPHKPLPKNIKLITLSNFIKFTKKLTPLRYI